MSTDDERDESQTPDSESNLYSIPKPNEEANGADSLVPRLGDLYKQTEDLTSTVENLERKRRQDTYEHTRSVIRQLEKVAKVASEAEAQLSREVAGGRVSTSNAKLLAERLAEALAALARALE